ncbi:MAG: DUF4906 domain-containing protein [Odoribacteraceae bacterium]|nr:DUF4906 domain-containing protein [Odoribacteraceae bacterium]
MNTSRVYLLALATCAVAACAEGPAGRPDAGGEGREALVTLSINAVPETPGTTGTRAIIDPVEEGTAPGYKVTDFWVLQYTGTADNAILATAPRYYTMSDFITVNNNLLALILPPAGQTYRCVLVANTHDAALDAGALKNASTLGALKNVSLLVRRLEDTYNDGYGDDLLMSGFIDLVGGSVPGSLACDLYRDVAKLTLTLVNEATSGVTINSVQLCNVPDRFSYADRLLTTAASPGAFFFNLTPVDDKPPLPLSPGNTCTLKYYLPRNRQGTTAATVPTQKNVNAPSNATYVQVMGQLADGTPLRYRFYPGENATNDFNITPNCHYTLPVTFNTAGTVIGDSRVENLGKVELVDANSYIITPLTTPLQTTYGVPVAGRVNDFWNKTIGGGNAISPATEWVAEVIWQDRDSRLIDFCTSNGAVTPGNTSFAGTGSERFYFKPTGPGVEGNVLVGVRLKTGGDGYLWSWHLWITGYNPDEAPSSWQENTFAYTVPGGQVHHYTGGPWADAYNNKFIMDRNLGAASGNRADGVQNTRGLYYQFGRKDPFPATNSVFAPVTLYDITGATGPTIPIVVNRSSFEGAVKNPTTYYVPGSSGGDWLLTNPYSTELWNNPSTWNTIQVTGKSFFDPCPPGWKLPINGTWAVFSLNNVNNPGTGTGGYGGGGITAGWEFYMDNVLKNAYAYYPAAGQRSYVLGNGTMSAELSSGYSWPSSPSSSTSGYYFDFNAATVWNLAVNRGYGFPVRCVQE